MTRREWPPILGGVALDWLWNARLHEIARLQTHEGPVIVLMVRGPIWRLNTQERKFLDDTATALAALAKHGP